MLNKLFKPSWTHPSASTRLQAIKRLDIQKTKQRAILTKLAQFDDDASVRLAAANRFQNIAVLCDLISGGDCNAIFIDQLASVLRDENTPCSDIQAVYGKLDNTLQPVVIAHCHDDVFRDQIVNEMADDMAFLLAVLGVTQFAKTRLQICGLINDLSSLEQAKGLLQNKDKASARLVKQKLSALKQQQSELRAQQKACDELLNEVTLLADKANEFNALTVKAVSSEQAIWRQDHSLKWKTLQNRWQSLNDNSVSETLVDQATKYTQLRAVIVQADEKFSAIFSAQQDYPVVQQALSSLICKIDRIDGLHQVDQWRNDLLSIEAQWQACAQHLIPQQHELVRFNEDLEQAGLLLDYAQSIAVDLASGSLKPELIHDFKPGSELERDELNLIEPELGQTVIWFKRQIALAPAGSQIKQQLSIKLKKYQQIAHANRQQFETSLDGVHKQINSVVNSLKAKDFSAASGKYRRLSGTAQRLLKDLLASVVIDVDHPVETVQGTDELDQQFTTLTSLSQLPNYQVNQLSALHERIKQVRDQLNELNDWKSFATEPQCLELCEAMNQLVSNRDNVKPSKQADDISDLLSKWKSLGSSNATDTHWPTFKAAMDVANEPCAVYFAQLKQTKLDNLAQLKKLADTMAQVVIELENCEQVNCTDFVKQVAGLDSKWKQFQNVERAKGQIQWRRFKNARDQIYVLLEPHFSENLSRKQTLIQRAETLLHQASEKGANDHTFDTLKHLQTAWKQIGVARQKDDSIAWREFKSHCDGVYDKIKQSRDELKAADQALIDQRMVLVNNIKSLAKSAVTIAELDHGFTQQQAEYEAIEPLPETVAERSQKQVDSQYRAACRQIDVCRERLLSERKASEMQHFIAKAELANRISIADNDELKVELVEQWQAIELLEPALKVAAKQRFDQAMSGGDVDLTQLERDKRLLCIQAEIISNSPTVAEDQALRTDYQLKQMQQSGLGNQADVLNSQHALQVAWYRLPGLPETLEDSLKARLDKAVEKIT